MLVCGLIKIAADYDVMVQCLEGLNGACQIFYECLPRMKICPILHVEFEALLVPCGMAYGVCGLKANLIDGVNGDRFLIFASQMDQAPSSHWISLGSVRFDPSHCVSCYDHRGASW